MGKTKRTYKVISPSGIVHRVEYYYENREDLKVVLCHYHNGTCFSYDIDVNWPETNKKVTCKNCLRGM